MTSHQQPKKRRIPAPQPEAGMLPPNLVVDVEVAEDEEVQWTWAALPGGGRYVSGYTIQKKAK